MSFSSLPHDYLALQNQGLADAYIPIKLSFLKKVARNSRTERLHGRKQKQFNVIFKKEKYYGRIYFNSCIVTYYGLELDKDFLKKLRSPVDLRDALALLFLLYEGAIPIDGRFFKQTASDVDFGPIRKLVLTLFGSSKSEVFQQSSQNPLFSNDKTGKENALLRLVLLKDFKEFVFFVDVKGDIYDGNMQLLAHSEENEARPDLFHYWNHPPDTQFSDSASESTDSE